MCSTDGPGPGDGGKCDPEVVTAVIGHENILWPCGLPPASSATCAPYCNGLATLGCYVSCNHGIPGTTTDYPWLDTDAGTSRVVVTCNTLVVTGRRPGGLTEEAEGQTRSAGELLALQAYLEAASVDAFLGLAAEMRAHGAPAQLVRRLRRAAADEVRHARVTADLARARGGEPAAPKVVATGVRSLLDIALENAREGCVRETWGAACAVAQGERAQDAEVREAMQAIARDELGHAALSWDLAAWLETRLTAEERAAVAAERARAVAELEAQAEGLTRDEWRRQVGMPSPEEARTILRGMREALWEARAAA
jgi:hypothetical protein